jgi:hypothetical protein
MSDIPSSDDSGDSGDSRGEMTEPPTIANLTSDFMMNVKEPKMKDFIIKLLQNDNTVLDKFNRILMASYQASSHAPLETLLALFNSEQLVSELNSNYTGAHAYASIRIARQDPRADADAKRNPLVPNNVTLMTNIIKKQIVKAIDIEFYKLFYPALFTDTFSKELEEILTSHLGGNVLSKNCGIWEGSTSVLRQQTTTKGCCKKVCDKMNSLDRALNDLFKRYGPPDGSLKYYHFSVKDFSKNVFYFDSKDTNPKKYVEYCNTNKHIESGLEESCKDSAERLQKFLPSNPKGVVVGGYSKNKYRRASKKSRKSHRRHRRSTRNKKHNTQQYKKNHTKRYRHRK